MNKIEERNRVILEKLPSIEAIAKHFFYRYPFFSKVLDADDLVGHGVIGLIKAINDFNPTVKNNFSAYSFIRIKGEMFDAGRRLTWGSRKAIEEWKHKDPDTLTSSQRKIVDANARVQNVFPLDSPINDSNGRMHLISDRVAAPDYTEEWDLHRHNKYVICRALEKLKPSSWRNAIWMIDIKGIPQTEIAKKLKVTPSAISIMRTRGLKRLKPIIIREEKKA